MDAEVPHAAQDALAVGGQEPLARRVQDVVRHACRRQDALVRDQRPRPCYRGRDGAEVCQRRDCRHASNCEEEIPMHPVFGGGDVVIDAPQCHQAQET
eukprot:CAMPEP_0198597882 /NCGR_PEP_ID=MMETSP1462-20131121/144992_1 /TAXON_ID=1333877 /ORGANISM="Brandtodinium nutriculum, Strain RCC3387" /LENGTH=97 /DNA_ID=CAMNT_0044329543 /DNA_START=9 /DNA_END=298 /DNA_ORIENTATION=+